MKKILCLAVIIGSFSVPSWAVTSQARQLGVVAASTATFTGAVGLAQFTLTQIATLTSTATGQMVFCLDCASANGGLGIPCVSTGGFTTNTLVGQFILNGSSLTAVTACK